MTTPPLKIPLRDFLCENTLLLHQNFFLQQGEKRFFHILPRGTLDRSSNSPLNHAMATSETNPIYLTTPLYYVNARPHIGHAYATILADVLAKFYRGQGRKTRFLTGTDEHGEKIAAIAKRENRTPLDYANEISRDFESTWKLIDLHPDVFYRTTIPSHYALVSSALQQLKDRGEIYFASYGGKYCMGCERFRTDQEWNENGVCPDHLTPPDVREESNYFFKMSAYRQRLIEFYKSHPEVIQPAQYLKETLSFLDQPLEDLCISRPTSRLEWGIPLPFDNKYVTYVWFDALLSYLGGIGFEGLPPGKNHKFEQKLWDESVHIIGKDILKTHAVYWPTMLMALGLNPFKKLQVSGYWLSSGLKMSKSLGNTVTPQMVKEHFGIEPFRYFLLREMSYGGDANFTWEAFVQRANSDLANGIGNLTSRSLTLSLKNLGGKVPSKSVRNETDHALLKEIHTLPQVFAAEFDARRYHMGLAAFGEAVARCDRYINDSKPWALAKDPTQKDRLEAVLGTAMDALWTLAVVGASVLPEGSRKLREALGRPDPAGVVDYVPLFATAAETLVEGSALGAEVPRLFPRLELPKEEPAK